MKNKKGAFYGRHSSDKQTLDHQLAAADELSKKYDFELVKDERYLDEDVSAGIPLLNRKGLINIMNDANIGIFDFIIVYSRDRLTRDPAEGQVIREKLNDIKMQLVICQPESLFDNNDILFQVSQDAQAKTELMKIRNNTRNAIQTLAKRGDWTGGKAPFGYKYEKKNNEKYGSFTPLEEELENVKKIFEMYKRNLGFQTIANELPGTYRGHKWTKKKVKAIVTNPFYAGYVSIYRDNQDRDAWIMTELNKSIYKIEPVISFQEWEYCWGLRRDREFKKIPPKFYYFSSFLFNGFISCEDCNQRLECKDQRTTNKKNGKEYGSRIYFCKTCAYSLEAEEMHKTVMQSIWKQIRKIDFDILYGALKSNIEQNISISEQEIKKLNSAKYDYQSKLILVNEKLDQFFNGNPQKNENFIRILKIRKDDLNRRISETNNLIQDKKKALEFLNSVKLDANSLKSELSFLDYYNSVPIHELRRLIITLIDEITINLNGKVRYRIKYDF